MLGSYPRNHCSFVSLPTHRFVLESAQMVVWLRRRNVLELQLAHEAANCVNSARFWHVAPSSLHWLSRRGSTKTSDNELQ